MTATLTHETTDGRVPGVPPKDLPHRVGPVTALRHGLTVAWRSILKIRRDPEQLIDLTVQPIMFTLLFTYVFGGAIAGGTTEYLQYALPGLIIQNAMFASMGTGIALNSDIKTGIFDRFRSLPIARSAPLVGQIFGDLARYLFSIGIMLGFGAVLGFRIHTGAAQTLAAVGLILAMVLAICWISVLIGLLVKEPQSVMVFGFVFVLPLTFASSAFVPTATMPGWLQAWVKVNPVTLLSDAVRGLLVSGHTVTTPALQVLVWSAGITLVAAPLAIRAYRRS